MSSISRRRLLGGTVCATVVGSCRKPPRPPRLRFVGQSAERGHAVRDGALVAMGKPADERMRADVVIVGAGVAGMAAAWRLRRAGLRNIVVLELEHAPGGTARAGQTSRSAYPMGAHYLPSPHPGFRGLNLLLEDLGVIMNRDGDGRPDFDPRSICAAPLERHRHLGVWDEGLYPARGQNADEEGQWIRWQAHLRELDGRLGPDGRRLFDLPVDRSSSALRHLDGISMAAYLDRLQLTSWRLRWTVDYACRDDYGCTAAQTSAYAALHHYLSRGLEGIHERTTLTWPEGNDHLVERMAAQAELGDAVLPSHAVVRIDPDEGTVHAWDLEQQRLIQIEAHVVLWSAPRFVLTRVLPPGRDPLGTGTLTYAPWLVTNIELARRPQGLGARLAWDNVPVDGQDLGYIVANHGEPATERVRPGAVLTLYEPLVATDGAGLHARRQHLLEGTLPVLAQRATDRLEALHPGIGDAIVQVDVARWGHGMIRPVPGLLFGTELATAAAPLGRILPCAADVSGLPLFEQAFSGGVRAAESALSRLGESVATIM